MICSPCYDNGKHEISMTHMEDIVAIHDPAEGSGYGEKKVCWFECPRCSHQEECDGTYHSYKNNAGFF